MRSDIDFPWFTTALHTGFAGMLGVLSGFAIFVLWTEGSGKGFLYFPLPLLVAVTVALIFERSVSVIEGRHEKLDFPRFVLTSIILAILELSIMAIHTGVETLHKTPGRLGELERIVVGKAISGPEVPNWGLILIVGLWIAIGSILSMALAATVFSKDVVKSQTIGANSEDKTLWVSAAIRSAGLGAFIGGFVAPLVNLTYIFAVRIVAEIRLIVLHHDKWRAHLDSFECLHLWTILKWPLYAVKAIDDLTTTYAGKHWGPGLMLILVVVVIPVVIRLAGGKERNQGNSGTLLLYYFLFLGFIFLLPILGDLVGLLKLAGMVAYMWIIPGVLIGSVIPFLSEPSEFPRYWAVLSLLASAVLLGIALVLREWTWVLLALPFALAAFQFRRGVPAKEYWPILALAVCVLVFAFTMLIRFGGFFDVAERIGNLARTELLLDSEVACQAGKPAILGETLASASDLLKKWASPYSSPSQYVPPSKGLPKRLLDLKLPESPAVTTVNLLAYRSELFQQGTQARALYSSIQQKILASQTDAEKTQSALNGYVCGDLGKQTSTRTSMMQMLESFVQKAEGVQVDVKDEKGILDKINSFKPPLRPLFLNPKLDRSFFTLERESKEGKNLADALEPKLKEWGDILETERLRAKELDDEIGKSESIPCPRTLARHFELATTSSLCFWNILGILVAWNTRKRVEAQNTAPKTENKS